MAGAAVCTISWPGSLRTGYCDRLVWFGQITALRRRGMPGPPRFITSGVGDPVASGVASVAQSSARTHRAGCLLGNDKHVPVIGGISSRHTRDRQIRTLLDPRGVEFKHQKSRPEHRERHRDPSLESSGGVSCNCIADSYLHQSERPESNQGPPAPKA